MRERSLDRLPLACALTRMEPTAQARALSGIEPATFCFAG